MKNPPVSSIRLDWISPDPQSESPRHAPDQQVLKHAGDKSVTMDAKKPLTITELAGESVSRIWSLDLQMHNLRRINERISLCDLWRRVFLLEANFSDMFLSCAHQSTKLL
jgi:hypothetical protein